MAKRWRDDQNQGTNTLLWGNDYPHGDSVFPHSQRILSEILRDCTPEERYEMTVKNVVELYNLPFTLNGPSQVKVAAGIGRS